MDDMSSGMSSLDAHERRMRWALQEAYRAMEEGEVPVGAIIVRDGQVIARAHNQVEQLHDPTAHAEILAITQAASAVGDWRLNGCVMYVTKEPCAMCAGAIVLARLDTVVWGVRDPRRGGALSVFGILNAPQLNHRCAIIEGILEEECRAMLTEFFRARRAEE
jgi:tRNA(adenine34) deaminase